MLEGLALGVPLCSTNGGALGSDEGIIIGYTDDELIGSSLVATDGNTLDMDCSTYETAYGKCEGLVLSA